MEREKMLIVAFGRRYAAFTRQTKVGKLVLVNIKKSANSCVHTSNSRQVSAHGILHQGRRGAVALTWSFRLYLGPIVC